MARTLQLFVVQPQPRATSTCVPERCRRFPGHTTPLRGVSSVPFSASWPGPVRAPAREHRATCVAGVLCPSPTSLPSAAPRASGRMPVVWVSSPGLPATSKAHGPQRDGHGEGAGPPARRSASLCGLRGPGPSSRGLSPGGQVLPALTPALRGGGTGARWQREGAGQGGASSHSPVP